ISFFDKTEDFYKKDTTFVIESLSSLKFNLLDVEENTIGEFSFGKTIKTPIGNMVVLYKNDNGKFKKSVTSVRLSSLERVTNRYRNKLQVTPVNKMTSVLTLSIVDPVKEIGVDFINKLIQKYNDEAINDKNIVAKNTENFINKRLQAITVELDTVEGDIEKFKKVNKVTDIVSEAQLFLQNSSEYEKNSIETATRLKVVDEVLKLINKSTNDDLIPANIVPDQGNTSGLIQEYNQLVLDKKRIAKGATAENPMVVNLEQQLIGLRQSITESLKNLKSSLSISQNDLRRQGGVLGGKIGEIPRQEREAREIGRKQQVKEALYLYLLQKREENAIALNVTAPNSKVIDQAYADLTPVSPKSSMIYLVALLLGVLVPFGIIYLYDLLDTKIKNRGDIEGKVQVPFIGDVPRSESHEELIKSDSRSSSAEAMRIIRTNLDFIVNQVPDGIAKTIFMTSTFPKEGKTFISVNLAGTFALSGKKVLLIGLDIRNPKLDEYMNLPNRGVTTYLSSKDVDLNDYLIKQDGYEHFYVLPAGLIPPNPAELLMGSKVEAMFESLKKQFDYIVVDTAPVSLVTDTLLIAKHADAFIYVVRANFLDK
ncbi:MAG: polysaccharide biosynthesis tyrosine autokinase, partial [Flavobacterium sp.]